MRSSFCAYLQRLLGAADGTRSVPATLEDSNVAKKLSAKLRDDRAAIEAASMAAAEQAQMVTNLRDIIGREQSKYDRLQRTLKFGNFPEAFGFMSSVALIAGSP